MTVFDTYEEAADGLLTGDAVLFVDGYPHALKVSDKGYPGMGVTEAESEKVIPPVPMRDFRIRSRSIPRWCGNGCAPRV